MTDVLIPPSVFWQPLLKHLGITFFFAARNSFYNLTGESVCACLQFYAMDPNSSYTTVETRDPLMARVVGQRQELSFFDVKLANKAYCEGTVID